jgi:hypothetical protein
LRLGQRFSSQTTALSRGYVRVWLECLWCVLPSKCVQGEAELILKAFPLIVLGSKAFKSGN